MTQSSDWPCLKLSLPAQWPEEKIGEIAQAVVDAGALGAYQQADSLTIYLPQTAGQTELDQLVQAVREETAGETIQWETGHLPNEPWAVAWKDYFTATPVGQRLLIRPDWEVGTPMPEQWAQRKPIYLRPGLGFGTGRHETTRLALEMIEQTLQPGQRMLDFGSGSCILGIAAMALGASEVWAIEYDPDANENARENMEINHYQNSITLLEADAPQAASAGDFDLIVCNVIPKFALPHMNALAAKLRRNEQGASSPSQLIYSGFLSDQINEVEPALEQAGLKMVHGQTLREWGALVAQLV